MLGLPCRASPAAAGAALPQAHRALGKIPATFIISDLDTGENNARYQLVEQGAIKLLYCAPERLDQDRVKPAEVAWLERLRPSYLVVGEAHCIDKWGGDFRPSYARLGEVWRRLVSPPVLAFTATAGVRNQQRVLGSVGIPDAAVFVRGVDRPKIAFLRLGEREETKRYRLIAALLRTVRHGRSMVFAPTIRIGNAIAAGLREQGLDVQLYHGKLRPSEREFLLKRYQGELEPPLGAVVCTSAFGMEIDVPDVHLEIHRQHPAAIDDTLRRSSAAPGVTVGRALAVLLRKADDRGLHRFMIDRSIENAQLSPAEAEAARQVKLEALEDMDELARGTARCFRRDVVGYFEAGRPRRSRSLAGWILQWAFAERGGSARARDVRCVSADPVHRGRAAVGEGGAGAGANRQGRQRRAALSAERLSLGSAWILLWRAVLVTLVRPRRYRRRRREGNPHAVEVPPSRHTRRRQGVRCRRLRGGAAAPEGDLARRPERLALLVVVLALAIAALAKYLLTGARAGSDGRQERGP